MVNLHPEFVRKLEDLCATLWPTKMAIILDRSDSGRVFNRATLITYYKVRWGSRMAVYEAGTDDELIQAMRLASMVIYDDFKVRQAADEKIEGHTTRQDWDRGVASVWPAIELELDEEVKKLAELREYFKGLRDEHAQAQEGSG